jgi:polyhydroxyalkanoate synthesis repressor PhaR
VTNEAPERVIKRYGNRKLYDPEAARYVTLEDLARMIAAGHDVRVVDQTTGHDLTTTVLAQVILEGLKARTARIPSQVLARLIRMGAAPAAAWSDWLPHEAAARAKDEAERIAGNLISRGRLTLEEALALRQEITGSVQRLVGEAQRGLEARLSRLLEGSEAEGAASSSMQALKDRLTAFETFLDPPRTTPGKGMRRSPRRGRGSARRA